MAATATTTTTSPLPLKSTTSPTSITSPPPSTTTTATDRQRKTVVYNFTDNNKSNGGHGDDDNTHHTDDDDLLDDDINLTKFPCVDELVKMFAQMMNVNRTKQDGSYTNNNNNNLKNEKKNGVEEMAIDASITTTNINKKQKTDDCIIEIHEKNRKILNHSPISDDQSVYCSSDDDQSGIGGNGKIIITNLNQPKIINNNNNNQRDKVTRSSSSDSAVGLDDLLDETTIITPPTTTNVHSPARRMTLTVSNIPLRPALLPLAEPTTLLPSTAGDLITIDQQTNVRSKMILESKVIEIQPSSTLFDSGNSNNVYDQNYNSRRESTQSFLSDYDETTNKRYMRTPSVVVSDYSDDIMCGITLEEIEYLRNQQQQSQQHNRRLSCDRDRCDDYQSDMSASSSCSNLNYCGSHISTLDHIECGIGGLITPERKISNCSTCSTISCDDDDLRERLTDVLNNANNKEKVKKVSQ